MTQLPPPVPDGWYPDPGGRFPHRYWEWGAWTTWVSDDGSIRDEPLPDRTAVAPKAQLPPRSLWWALGGFLISLFLAVLASLAAESLTSSLLLSLVTLDVGLVLTVWVVTRRYGTGSLVDDLGLRFTRHDVGGGLAAGIAARALAGSTALTVLWLVGEDIESTNVQFDTYESNDAALYLALLAAVLVAPFVEEVFFRGLLQGVLTRWIGVPAGVVVQAVLFALIHFQVDASAGANLVLMAAVGVGGAVFGVAYQITGRLGSAIVGHTVFNLIAGVLILVTR